jgi:hypothetical protein
LFRLAEQLERAPEEALVLLRHSLAAFREEQRAAETDDEHDRKLIFEPPVPARARDTSLNQVLLTGGTGFIGPFLMKELCWNRRGRRSMFSSVFRRGAGQAKTEGGDGIDGTLPGKADGDVRGSGDPRLRRSRAAQSWA